MASSDNLASLVEPWAFRSSFADSWFSEAFLRDNETLTKALQKSISNESETLTTDSNNNSSLVQLVKSEPAPTPTSTMSGSDPEMAPKQQQQQRRNTIGATSGKISKRKSRASKRSPTTFITADPANFRQMVQQVTGIGFCNPHLSVDATTVAPVLKPEPQRLGNRLQSCLPTLDTSAFLLDRHHQQQQIVGPTQATLATGHASFAPVADGGSGFEFDSYQSFPTLESWRVM